MSVYGLLTTMLCIVWKLLLSFWMCEYTGTSPQALYFENFKKHFSLNFVGFSILELVPVICLSIGPNSDGVLRCSGVWHQNSTFSVCSGTLGCQPNWRLTELQFVISLFPSGLTSKVFLLLQTLSLSNIANSQHSCWISLKKLPDIFINLGDFFLPLFVGCLKISYLETYFTGCLASSFDCFFCWHHFKPPSSVLDSSTCNVCVLFSQCLLVTFHLFPAWSNHTSQDPTFYICFFIWILACCFFFISPRMQTGSTHLLLTISLFSTFPQTVLLLSCGTWPGNFQRPLHGRRHCKSRCGKWLTLMVCRIFPRLLLWKTSMPKILWWVI